MTEPFVMPDPESLTGAQVRELREALKLSRRELAQLADFPTETRLVNIERKDSWKPGNREALASALVAAISQPAPTKGRRRGETGEQRAARLDAALRARDQVVQPAFWFDDDDPVSAPATYEPESVYVAQHLATPITTTNTAATSITVNLGSTAVPLTLEPRPLSNSEVATWNRCRRKWWLTWYRQLALNQVDLTGPRAIGNRVHRALRAWYVPPDQVREDPRVALERVIVDDWTYLAQQTRERATSDVDLVLGDLAAKFNDATGLERAMVEGYVQWVEETGADAHLEVIAAETAINAEIKVGVEGSLVPVKLIGKLDVRARRTTDDVHVFIDHKTVGNLTDPRKTLHLDPQMLHYHLLEWLASPEGERRCDGALYNMLRKVKRSAQARPPFYERVEVHHNQHELDAYLSRLQGAASDVIRTERLLSQGWNPLSVVYPTPQRSCSWDCDFFAICPMFDDGSHVEAAVEGLYHQVDPMARYAEEAI